MSYDGQVNFGLVGDYDAMADLDSFALDLEAGLRETIDTVAPAPKRRATRKSENGAASLAPEAQA